LCIWADRFAGAAGTVTANRAASCPTHIHHYSPQPDGLLRIRASKLLPIPESHPNCEPSMTSTITEADKPDTQGLVEQLDELIAQSEVQYHVFPGTTVTACCVRLPSGYCTAGFSQCPFPSASYDLFDRERGEHNALRDARRQLALIVVERNFAKAAGPF
jgi:hypothetical protein